MTETNNTPSTPPPGTLPGTNRVALVTGGGWRLGAVLTRALAQWGYTVVVHAHSHPNRAEALIAEITSQGGKAFLLQGDLALAEDRDALIPRVIAVAGQLDVLINNAGLFKREPVGQIRQSTWDETMAVNLTAPMFLGQMAGEWMRGHRGGVIINLVSAGAYQRWIGYPAYCVSKAGLVATTELLALALAPSVRVCGIAPGIVRFPDESAPGIAIPDEESLPLKRFNDPQEIVAALNYLLHHAPGVTGQIIHVDSGKTLRA